ncbi:MAG: hypothetical protein U9N56_02965 [Actinomycetota bacterium]|nr:hypothetical protein [Actinomycetota bacterium]
MGKLLGIAALVLIGLVVFSLVGTSLPDTNPLHGVAEGIRAVGRGMVDSIYGVGRGVSGSFGG